MNTITTSSADKAAVCGDSLQDALKYIVRKYGAEALTDKGRTISTVADIIPTRTKEANLLSIFYNCGGAALLKNTPKLQLEDAMRKQAIRMTEQWGTSPEGARYVCDCVLNAIMNPNSDRKPASAYASITSGEINHRASTACSRTGSGPVSEGGGESHGSSGVPTAPARKPFPLKAAVGAAAVLLVLYFVLGNGSAASRRTELAVPSDAYITDLPTPVAVAVLSAAPFSGDFGDDTRLYFSKGEASSTVGSYDGQTFYGPENAFDDDTSTSWQEGSSGYGIGEYLKLYFDSTVKLRILSFRMGSYTLADYFVQNGKPHELMLEFSDGRKLSYEFPETDQEYIIELSESVSTQWVKLTIISAYPGTKWEDTSIAEVKAFGHK